MLTCCFATLKKMRSATYAAAAACLLASSIPLTAAPAGNAAPGGQIAFTNAAETQTPAAAEKPAADFLRAMAEGDVDSVWMFASEEDQDAFAVESAVFQAFSEAFPALRDVKAAIFTRFWQEGDTPFAELLIRAADGDMSRATMGFWLDDAGDWKLISCDVRPWSDRIAGL